MDDNQTNLKEETTEERKKVTKPQKPVEKRGKKFFASLRSEFSKVIWASRPELFKQTITVIVVSLLFGIIIFLMDTVFNFGYVELAKLLGRV